MERKRQREIGLAVAAALVVATVAYKLVTLSPASAGTPQQPAPASPAHAAASNASQPKGLTEVDLAALSAPKAQPQEVVRNPFRFKPKPPPPPPPAPMPSQMPVSAVPAGPPPPPPISLKYFGYIEVPGKGLSAQLTDGRGVYRGFTGDILEGRYRILRIGVESIELAYLDGRGRQTIRLTGQ